MSQTDKNSVNVSVQTNVIIPASERIYNHIPAGMVDKVDVLSIGYVIKKDKRIINSDRTKTDEKIVYDSQIPNRNVPTANYSSTADHRVTLTENPVLYQHSTQSSVDPINSLADVEAKARYQALKEFRNFPHN